jgi:hypothetical protein
MRRIALAAVLAMVVLPSGAAQAKPIVPCGDIAQNGSGVYEVTVRALTCRRGRSVARRWMEKCGPVAGTCRVRGMRCRTSYIGDELRATRCVDGHMLVKFKSGS